MPEKSYRIPAVKTLRVMTLLQLSDMEHIPASGMQKRAVLLILISLISQSSKYANYNDMPTLYPRSEPIN